VFNIFKRSKKYPEFSCLRNFYQRDQYFIRIAEWDWLNKENVVVTDPNNARILTLGPWPQYVFIAANGQMTVTEYVYYMADKYSSAIPELLDKTIIDEVVSLVNYGIIKLVEKKQRPESLFELPRSHR
jgi:hypothetical protein